MRFNGAHEHMVPQISIVVPVYRSEDCLEELVSVIEASLAATGWAYEVILVNDCSPDGSWKVIESLCEVHPEVVGVHLRRNFGQDNAILTGLRFARGEYIVVMDDDLQHHPGDIPKLMEEAIEGADVVYAQFLRKHQRWWKNLGSWFNGKVAEWVINKPRNLYLSPFKLIRREVAQSVSIYDGPDPYLDGLLLQVTSNIAQVQVSHHTRYAGESNYTLLKSLSVWARHAFSFSVLPLRMVSICGFISAVLGMGLAALVILYRLLLPQDFPPGAAGWASLMVALSVIGGMQMIFLGILGEYAGRTFLRVNNKPQAAISKTINTKSAPNAHASVWNKIHQEPNVAHEHSL